MGKALNCSGVGFVPLEGSVAHTDIVLVTLTKNITAKLVQYNIYSLSLFFSFL